MATQYVEVVRWDGPPEDPNSGPVEHTFYCSMAHVPKLSTLEDAHEDTEDRASDWFSREDCAKCGKHLGGGYGCCAHDGECGDDPMGMCWDCFDRWRNGASEHERASQIIKILAATRKGE